MRRTVTDSFARCPAAVIQPVMLCGFVAIRFVGAFPSSVFVNATIVAPDSSSVSFRPAEVLNSATGGCARATLIVKF